MERVGEDEEIVNETQIEEYREGEGDEPTDAM